ncbi:adenylyl cyclase X E-like isoform X2 [Drosophila miranda]|uniref:adenylyl cyclase X E-like isoform X2 n=1 Tax=Drosophila miranda TaxID=7229 RepID=UPI00143F876E|nr:adenylyl cyclase X E-like isoform X2 [Drosophila miranda]
MPRQGFVDDVCQYNYTKERLWERSYLLVKCAELHLEEEYRLYQARLWNSFLGVFLLLHTLITIAHCAMLLFTCEHPHLIYFDVALYIASAFIILTVMSVNFCENLAMRHSWITYTSAVVSAFALVSAGELIDIQPSTFTIKKTCFHTADIFQGTYHYYKHDWALDTFYDTYIVYMIYMFMPIPIMSGALLLGVTVSVVYIAYFWVYVAEEYYSDEDYGRFSLDIFHHLGFNLLGMFFRIMNDIVVRSSFLDRHQYIMEKIWLRNARRQEKLVLHSIIPPQIAKPIQDDIQNRLARKLRGLAASRSPGVMEHVMAIQIHPEVSILYADVVNYTKMTTTLNVEKLVRLLHDLYGRFDMAATQFEVQRIKFLGDCYYCVAGLMRPSPDHAKNCVDLGLSMISHIQEVRRENDVDINMRIGVHSGSVIAGVIGEAKLQYDIWGTDVTIANHLESTGSPGFVHVSASTLNELEPSEYTIIPGTDAALEDPVLSKHNISTFQISTEPSPRFTKRTTQRFESQSHMDIPARPDLYRTKDHVINEELRHEFRKMPVSSFKQIFSWRRRNQSIDLLSTAVTKFCLVYRDSNIECKYLRSPDLMFKYSMLLAWSIGCSLAYIQQMSLGEGVLLEAILLDVVVLTFLTALLVISWYKKFCWLRYGNKENNRHRFGKLSCWIFRTSEKIQASLSLRICIYLFIICAYNSVIFIMMMECDREEFEVMYIDSKLYHYDDIDICFNPWVITNVVSLIIGMSFTFTSIPFVLKIVVCLLMTISYLIVIFFHLQFIFHHSWTTNPFFAPEYAHCTLIIITFVTLYLKERHAEFTNKVNFNWRMDLKRKQRDAQSTNYSIIILLNNILPAHVVNIYLTSLAKHELYYEEYKIVSVMFATLKNFELSLRSLRLLNEIITEFDRLLHHYKDNYVVEKIKIVGCTYMAACGLDVNFAGRISKDLENRETYRDSLMEEVEQAQNVRRASSKIAEEYPKEVLHEEVVFVMTTFALDLMRTLWMLNKVYETVSYDKSVISPDMSIGISSGEVMAGIVGASHPHYDIWGHPVNMASRMDSTGMIGHIQVTKETAILLGEFGIMCNFRGQTYVKGSGNIPTYFVAIDDDYEFITTGEKRIPKRQYRERDVSMSDNESIYNPFWHDDDDEIDDN